MTRFHWVRHGPTHATGMIGWTDLPADLSDRAAVERLRAALPEGAPVVSSDLARARATAEALGAGRPRLPDMPGLREIHFGAWEGRGFDPIDAADEAQLRAFWDTPGSVAPPGGESWDALAARVGAAIAVLARDHAGGDIVVVAHLGPVLAALQIARGLAPRQALGQRIDPLSLTSLSLRDGVWQVDAVNRRP
jgi:broad specificity phosphatase PhoE